ncbi:hypothetical protein KZ844_30630, partial [Pseudomonas aeruginosa]|uniref:hypothetical protein n=1 Tax=Pseudomonas aeruginosa TaxID=287 RepID=UPI001CA55F65
FKQKTTYEFLRCLVGSEMCIRDRPMGGSAVRRWPALAAPAGLSGIRERLAEERAASRPSLPDNPDTLPPACG